MLKRKLIVLSVLAAIATTFISIAEAHPHPNIVESKLGYRTALITLRPHVNQILENKCRPTYRYTKSVWDMIHPHAQTHIWQARHVRAHEISKGQCLPTTAEGIIRYVFPESTESAAVRVADCESGLYTYAKNPVSSASGLFQLLSFHWYGKFNPFDPWANTRYAYRLSNAGTNWGPWVCKP